MPPVVRGGWSVLLTAGDELGDGESSCRAEVRASDHAVIRVVAAHFDGKRTTMIVKAGIPRTARTGGSVRFIATWAFVTLAFAEPEG
jgi:hypothetical protein